MRAALLLPTQRPRFFLRQLAPGVQGRKLMHLHRVALGQCAQPFPFRPLPLVQVADVQRQRGRVYGGETRQGLVALSADLRCEGFELFSDHAELSPMRWETITEIHEADGKHGKQQENNPPDDGGLSADPPADWVVLPRIMIQEVFTGWRQPPAPSINLHPPSPLINEFSHRSTKGACLRILGIGAYLPTLGNSLPATGAGIRFELPSHGLNRLAGCESHVGTRAPRMTRRARRVQ